MRRFVTYLILVPLAVIAIALSVANRGTVAFSLDPFGAASSRWTLAAPMFVFLFAALALGVVIGGVATWMRQRKWRRAARIERAKAERLRHEADQLRQRMTALPAIAGPLQGRDAA
jgi:uncharacterized membrane protein YciS (DUF1049 family)